jgi:gamma-glutamylputrescine oxidase
MTTAHWSRSFKSSQNTSTDIAIVGAGYAGLSTAYWLSEMKPDLKITIIDRGFLGAGASGRNAGFLTKGSAAFYRSLSNDWGLAKAKEIYQFAGDSLKEAYNHILKDSAEIEFEKTNSFTFSKRDEDFNPSDFNFSWVSQEKLPSQLLRRFEGGYSNGPEYKINPLQLLLVLRKKLEQRGVKILEGVSGFSLFEEGILTEVSQIKAKKVILTLNGYFPQFHTSFKNIITPRRAQMLAVQLKDPLDCPSLYYDPAHRVYWRMTKDNVLLIGGKRLLDAEGETGDFEKLSSLIQNGLESYVTDTLGLEYEIRQRWSGIMAFTEHELPFITKITAPVESYAMGGFSGHGMGFGFKSGKEMAEIVCGKKAESFFTSFAKVNISL